MTDQITRLRALAAHFRRMARDGDTVDGALAYDYCADALEREIAEPVVRDMLAKSVEKETER